MKQLNCLTRVPRLGLTGPDDPNAGQRTDRKAYAVARPDPDADDGTYIARFKDPDWGEVRVMRGIIPDLCAFVCEEAA